MRSKMKNDMFLTYNKGLKARSRYLSSYKDEIHPFCSLHRLAYAIGMTYNELPDVFVELTEQKVREIQKSVKDGTYTLSPLLLRAFARKGDQKPGFFHTFPAKDESNLYLGINPTLEDSLVLTALGRMLNLHFLRVNLFTDKSFGLRTKPNAFYSTVCARGKVLRLYKCDLTISLRTINRESLLLNLSHIVKDGAIIEFVDKFLSVPILDQSGRDFTAEMGCSIPTVGLLTHVLLNFALTEFDKEFQRAFPGVDYSRYIHEVFIYCPKISTSNTCSSKQGKTLESEAMQLSFFDEQQVLSLLDQLNLAGKILSIGPGDAPVPCYGGLVCVSQDGQIKVKEKILD